MYRVYIKYCVFSEFLKIFRALFFFGVNVCTHTRQVEHQRCSSTGRVQKNKKKIRENTIFMAVLCVSEFHWSPETIGYVDSSFFWGYIVTQLPGGFLASK